MKAVIVDADGEICFLASRSAKAERTPSSARTGKPLGYAESLDEDPYIISLASNL